ncbi:MAG: ribonuclease Z [Bacteroidia bacterium]|nr:MAG: ribonuclease Z [Bacteroidia bacterium]
MYLPPFEINILGTSSAIPAFDRFPTAQLIHINGSYVLIDCGEGTQMQLRKYKLPAARIDVVLISHLHGDHIFGLPGLLTSLSLLQREKELLIIAPKELEEIIKLIIKHCEAKIVYPLKFIYTQTKEVKCVFENKKFKVYSFPLIHRVPTTGFVILEQERERNIIKEKIKEYNIPIHQFNRLKKGLDAEDEEGNVIRNEDVTIPPLPPRKYVYCSDTAVLKDIPEIVLNPDVLYHETTFLKEHQNLAEITQHSTTIDAAMTAKKISAKKLLIGHYSSRYENLEPLLIEARSIFENTVLAREGLRVKI